MAISTPVIHRASTSREYVKLYLVSDPPASSWEVSFDAGETWLIGADLPGEAGWYRWLVAGSGAELGDAVVQLEDGEYILLARATDSPELVVRVAAVLNINSSPRGFEVLPTLPPVSPTTADSVVSALIADEDSDTRSELDTLLSGAGGGSDAQVAAYVANPSSDTHAAVSATIVALLGDVADPENVAELLAGAAVAAAIYGYEDHGDVSGAVSIDPAIGTHVLDATGPTVLSLGSAANGTIISVEASSGADDVAVDGFTGVELTDGSPVVFRRVRDEWKFSVVGGETGTPDGTPPSAVTDLVATGGEGQVSGAWSASTDAESDVSYRWRVWLTSGGATGAWTTTTSLSFLKTGLAAGAYTVEVYAYSAGGASATDTATATVTAALVPITDSFTAADGSLAGHVPDSGTAAAWSNGSGMGYMPSDTIAPSIAGNKVSMSGNVARGGKLPVGHTTSTVFEFDYTVTPGATPDSNIMFSFGDVDNYFYTSLMQNGDVVLYHYPSFTPYANVSGQPASGRVSFTYSGNAITLKINGTTIATGTRTMVMVAPHIAIGTFGSVNVATIDNLSVMSS